MPSINVAELEAVRPLTAREFEQIRRLAYRTFGLDLKDGKQELVSARLRRLVCASGLHTYQDYYRTVVEDRTGVALAAMIDALATNHTSFLREPDHFRFLRDHVIPGLARHGPGSRSGARPVPPAKRCGPWLCCLEDALPGRDFPLSGSDISNKALARARARIVSGGAGGRTAAGLVSRNTWSRGAGQQKGWYRVSAAWRTRAEFRRLNLVEPYSWPRPFPVIFCRNVMIYFDKPTQEKVVSGLAASLEPGGYLFVGHAESLTGVRHVSNTSVPRFTASRPARGGDGTRRGGSGGLPGRQIAGEVLVTYALG